MFAARVVLGLLLVSSAFASNSWDAFGHHANIAEHAQSHYSSILTALNSARSDIATHVAGLSSLVEQASAGGVSLQAVSTACANAVSSLSTLSNCAGSFAQLFAQSANTAGTCSSAVTTYCASGGCAAQFNTVLSNIMSSCQGADLDASQSSLRKLLAYVNLPCVTDTATPPVYCFCKFYALVSLSSSSTGLAAQLPTICVPCTYIFFARLSSYADMDASFAAIAAGLSLLCLTDGTTYCYPYITTDLVAYLQTHTSATDTYSYACANRCFEKYLAFLQLQTDFRGNSTQLTSSNSIRALCARDSSGNLCIINDLNYIAAHPELQSNCPDPNGAGFTANAACNTNCATAIQAFSTSLGCCVQAYLVAADLSQPNNPRGPTIVTWARNKCSAAIASPCVAATKVTATFILGNLLYTYYQANAAAINANLAADLGTSLQVPPSDVSITSASSSTTTSSVNTDTTTTQGVSFSISIVAGSSTAVSSIANQLSTSAQAGTLTFPSTSASIPPSGMSSSTSSISISSSTLTVQSSAPHTQLSAWVLVVSLLGVLAFSTLSF